METSASTAAQPVMEIDQPRMAKAVRLRVWFDFSVGALSRKALRKYVLALGVGDLRGHVKQFEHLKGTDREPTSHSTALHEKTFDQVVKSALGSGRGRPKRRPTTSTATMTASTATASPRKLTPAVLASLLVQVGSISQPVAVEPCFVHESGSDL